MNIFTSFENRISSIFDGATGAKAPLSFKRLAKRATKKMREETYVINGVDTAPALYTVLISSKDDAVMRPMYRELCRETSDFLVAKAKENNTVLVGKPLVRFMVDPSLRSGKFAVFAENVDTVTLHKLREEELAFINNASVVGGAALQQNPNIKPISSPIHNQSAIPVPEQETVQPHGIDSGLDVMPEDLFNDEDNEMSIPAASVGRAAIPVAPVAMPAPMPAPMPVPTPAANMNIPQVNPVDIPKTQRRPSAVTPQQAAANATVVSAPQATCLLIDRNSGQTYMGHAPQTFIGRERQPHNIVLKDTNVSRRHAQLVYDGANWHIKDLNSTNGTLVNNVVIDDCILRNGDLLTFGLINLEFREG